MYRIGRRGKKKAKRKIWVFILVILIIACGAAAFLTFRILSEDTEQTSLPKAITREYEPPQGEDVKIFTQDTFTFSLPSDWVFKGHNEYPTNIYSYQATKKDADNRTLEIYVDRVPTDKAFNRILPVVVLDNKISVTGSVSENCVEFTGLNGVNPQTAGVATLPSKWQGVDFTCDVGNYTRNLVGVATVAAKSNISLTGPASKQHIYYFLYIDHNINPNYQILEKALESFTVK
jgi:hypothetical protein